MHRCNLSLDHTYHDNPPGLLGRAHAHDGSHADGGALEVHSAVEEGQGNDGSESPHPSAFSKPHSLDQNHSVWGSF